MINAIALGGEPATGKTRIMNRVIKRAGKGRPFRYELVRGLQFDEAEIIVLGIYDGGEFQGTDRLSMAVQPDAIQLIDTLNASRQFCGWTVMFEGDRLFNCSFLEFLSPCLKEAILLEAGDKTLAARHQKRGDSQTGKWLKGRKTKYYNLRNKFEFTVFKHEDDSDTEAIVEHMLR
jgi:predicted transcriptional regulator